MHAMENGLRKVTLLMALSITGSLLVAASGIVFETPLLAYFWYFALAGMGVMFVLTLALGVNWLVVRLIRHYHRMVLQWGAV